jgi:putative methionine-R-sulfoxide reductase with GAF domain
MAQKRKSDSKKKGKPNEIQLTWPLWYLPENPTGSALRYLAALSPQFQWIGIYLIRGSSIELGPHLGKAIENPLSSLVTLVKNSRGKKVAQIEIQNPERSAFSAEEVEAVRKIAQELGELWSTGASTSS